MLKHQQSIWAAGGPDGELACQRAARQTQQGDTHLSRISTFAAVPSMAALSTLAYRKIIKQHRNLSLDLAPLQAQFDGRGECVRSTPALVAKLGPQLAYLYLFTRSRLAG